MLLSENTVWFDIGEMDSDRYEEQQKVLQEFTLPAFNPVIPLLFPTAESFNEDLPF